MCFALQVLDLKESQGQELSRQLSDSHRVKFTKEIKGQSSISYN